jgi:drug/metabolite transporter (DMT)-like permease
LRRAPWPELVLVALTLAWGLSFVVIPATFSAAGFLSLTFLRMAVGVAFLFAVRPTAFRPTRLEWRAGVLGGLLLAEGYFLQTIGMGEAEAGKSGFLTAFYICLVPVLEALVYRRLPPGRDLLALGAATVGIGLLVLRADLTMSFGEALVGASALCWAAQIVVVGRVASQVDPLRLAAVQLLVVLGVAGIGAPFAGEAPVRWSWAFVGAILFLGVATNALGFLGQAWAQQRVPPTRTAVLFSCEPVFAALFGFWFAGESFGAREFAGAALVLAAVAADVLAPRSESRADAAGG